MLTNLDIEKLTKFYKESLELYGAYDSKSVRWNDFYTQNIRFKTFVEAVNLEDKNILDIGCGLGDFYFYLKSNLKNFNYVGLDIFKEFIELAKSKYPDAKFLNATIHDIDLSKFDYAFASGVFSMNIDKAAEKYMSIIKYIYSEIGSGFIFNMLLEGKHPDDHNHVTYDPNEVRKECLKFAKDIQIVTGYLDYDFTVILRK